MSNFIYHYKGYEISPEYKYITPPADLSSSGKKFHCFVAVKGPLFKGNGLIENIRSRDIWTVKRLIDEATELVEERFIRYRGVYNTMFNVDEILEGCNLKVASLDDYREVGYYEEEDIVPTLEELNVIEQYEGKSWIMKILSNGR